MKLRMAAAVGVYQSSDLDPTRGGKMQTHPSFAFVSIVHPYLGPSLYDYLSSYTLTGLVCSGRVWPTGGKGPKGPSA